MNDLDWPSEATSYVCRRSGMVPRANGAFVLYWMRTAVRAHENPALDVALESAERLGLPICVYHGLSERYRYASDRHHRFILEGARDVQAEMAQRGIGYLFHLERPGQRGPVLVELARQAAFVVTEEMPVEPLRRWTAALIEAIDTPVWTVDTACLASMTTSTRLHERAFKFRSAMQRSWNERIDQPWLEAPVPGPVYAPPNLPFEPLDLQRADLAALISSCEIDHSIAPVPHTPGGAVAGYRRWDHFRVRGLKAYARKRNDPLSGGVSRMSAYLHYGHVAPRRLAREAAETGGPGAEKFLDELLVWRELSYHWCYQKAEQASTRALPDWAQETLQDHRADARDWIDADRLSRGATGDRLWDACQHSLRVHGELHNNVRMTWGKAIPLWSHDGQQALDRLIGLNHRYALDGRDPNSYGGLLWCLGLFDRPFTPEVPILGTIRPRSTQGHARRLDVDTYGRQMRQATVQPAPIAVVHGGGFAGLFAARTMLDHGWQVTWVGEEPMAEDGAPCGVATVDHPLRYQFEAWREAGWLEQQGDAFRVADAELAAGLFGDVRRGEVPGDPDVVIDFSGDPAVAINPDQVGLVEPIGEEPLLAACTRAAGAAGRALGHSIWFET